MKLNRIELKKVQYDFNSRSNRLLQADYNDYLSVLKKYISFLDNTSIIHDYIVSCGECTQNLDEEFTEVRNGYGRFIFSIGESTEEEVCNVYSILKYITENNILVHYNIAQAYSSSTNFAERIKGFNHRLVMILIGHIESYLTKVGIEMGLDEKIVYNVTVHDGQAIIATDNAVVNANNAVSVNGEELKAIIEKILKNSDDFSPEEKESISESLEVIEAETTSEKPKKSMIKTAVAVLKGLKGTAEFAAAVAELVQFIGTFM